MNKFKLIKIAFWGFTTLLYFITPVFAQLSVNLEIGLSTDANVCGNSNSITVDPGTDVTVCYKISNTGTNTIEETNLINNFLGNIESNQIPDIFSGNTYGIERTASQVSSTMGLTSEAIMNDYKVLNYRVSSSDDANGPSYNFIDISTTGLALNLSDDGEYTYTNMPFNFYYADSSTQYFVIGNNGAIQLGSLNTQVASTNTQLSSSLEYMAAPFWDDLSATTGNVYIEVVGTAPNRKYIIQWDNISHTGGVNPVSFQIQLFETSNEIQFHYKDVDFGNIALDKGKSASIGIGNRNYFNEFSFNQASLSNSFALSFIPKKVSHRHQSFFLGNLSYNFEDISGTGTALNLGDDDYTGITMPFAITLGSGSSADLSISNNGAVRHGTLSQNISWQNVALEFDSSDNIIAPYWVDLDATSGNVYYQTKGTAPNRRFIVQWHQRPIINVASSENVTFELKIFEGTNGVEFHYQDLNVNDANYNYGKKATIGLRGTYANAVQFSYDYPALSDSNALLFHLYNAELRETATASIIVNAPDISLYAAFTDYSLPINTSFSSSFDIDNLGMYPLTWTLSENIGKNNSNNTILNSDDFVTIKSDTIPQLGSFNLSLPSFVDSIAVSEEYLDSYAGDFYAGDLSHLYVLRSPTGSSASFVQINVDSGNIVFIGNTPAPANQKWTGMTWNRIDGKMYALASGNSGSSLHTIDISNGAATLYQSYTLGNLSGLAAVMSPSSFITTAKIYTIDTLNNNLISLADFSDTSRFVNGATIIGPLGYDAQFYQSLEFDDTTQKLYWLSCSTGTDCGKLRSFNSDANGTLLSSSIIVNQIGTAGDSFTLLARINDVDCNNNVPWLSFATSSGTTNSGMTDTVTFTIDTTNLPYGFHSAYTCIKSNDPDEPTTILPISVYVIDIIFRNGFE